MNTAIISFFIWWSHLPVKNISSSCFKLPECPQICYFILSSKPQELNKGLCYCFRFTDKETEDKKIWGNLSKVTQLVRDRTGAMTQISLCFFFFLS